jgi:hypothetical protein
MFYRFSLLAVTVLTSLICLTSSSQAETCTPLSLVGGQGSEVDKTVSQPTIPGPFGIDITHNNWNTDWAVSGNNNYKYFIATIVSEQGGSFDIKMYLKYSNQTATEFYNTSGVQLKAGKPLKIEATPRPDDEPYQVNLFIGGLNHIGNNYKASVVGCK